MRTIAVVGIDGSGKTVFTKKLAEKIGAYTLHIPGFDGVGSRTTHYLGKLYAKFADFGHRIKSHRVVSLAYKMTALLYNEFIKYHQDKEGTVLVERHPAVDAIVYADEYDGVDGLEETAKYVYSHIPELPDAVIWVRPDSIEAAVDRINERIRREGGVRELHESYKSLLTASKNYQQVLPFLEKNYNVPFIEVHSNGSPEEMVDYVMRQPKFHEVLGQVLDSQQYTLPATAISSPQ